MQTAREAKWLEWGYGLVFFYVQLTVTLLVVLVVTKG